MYESNLSRRRILAAAGGVAIGALAGCLGDDDAPEPIALDDGQSCDQCGMVIEEHPGPTGQIFFEDYPDDREGPAHFCSGTCTYRYRFDAEDAGETPIVTYLTDYSGVDYSLTGDEEQPFISAHLDADDYAEETGITFVAGSDAHGAMGPDLIPFEDDGDATTFADEHGGDVVTHGEINRELLDAMGN
ncbi:nitrous oxide reductase accessory protein NosL [Natranaeroarchaeum aerophilus]|uniref:Nitrous oxide reductase accessory protein NosL n=1 Tax=Natranaeroarchaeum aerophilus TaxID=2917711 RepID=A0AAE3FPW4_9EURY|nr:nitrous oxide reductase accessory protein NosL [Natranaeroarchaeum aerophilus]MCL9813069.1 nitrous oxide reductase accessory protein NosL [Natranaeroarchaeum aerophilus]